MPDDDTSKLDKVLTSLNLHKNDEQKRRLLNEPAYKHIKDALFEIADLIEYLGSDNILSPYDLKKLYRYYKFYNASSVPTGAASRIENNASYWMDCVYLGLTLTSLVVSAASLGQVNLPLISSAKFSVFSGAAWNSSDSGGCGIIALEQWRNGEKNLAVFNVLSSLQQVGFSAPATVMYALGEMCASTAVAYLGATFAVSTIASYLIEVYEVRRCDKKLEYLQQKLNNIAVEDPKREQKIKTLKTAIAAEYAVRAFHERNAKSWLFCSVAMICVSIIAFLALSTLTLGAVPIASVVVAGISLLSGMIRKAWVNDESLAAGIKMFDKNYKSHQQQVKEQSGLFVRLSHLKNLPIMTNKVEILGFFHAQMTLYEYINSVITTNLEKATKLIKALEDDPDGGKIDTILSQETNRTLSFKLLNSQSASSSASNLDPDSAKSSEP